MRGKQDKPQYEGKALRGINQDTFLFDVGDKPRLAEFSETMAVMWELDVPMGANIFRQFSVIGDV